MGNSSGSDYRKNESGKQGEIRGIGFIRTIGAVRTIQCEFQGHANRYQAL
jgi:hypothetical protein